ncbi:hypothetical protein V8E36_006270, partial [Tilletia maclaganii]
MPGALLRWSSRSAVRLRASLNTSLRRIGDGALYFNSDNRSKKLFDEVRPGKKNAVLVSPDMVLSNDFLALFEHEGFRSRLAGFIFDEVHAVVDWGDTVRTKMKELGQLRLGLADRVMKFQFGRSTPPKF